MTRLIHEPSLRVSSLAGGEVRLFKKNVVTGDIVHWDGHRRGAPVYVTASKHICNAFETVIFILQVWRDALTDAAHSK